MSRPTNAALGAIPYSPSLALPFVSSCPCPCHSSLASPSSFVFTRSCPSLHFVLPVLVPSLSFLSCPCPFSSPFPVLVPSRVVPSALIPGRCRFTSLFYHSLFRISGLKYFVGVMEFGVLCLLLLETSFTHLHTHAYTLLHSQTHPRFYPPNASVGEAKHPLDYQRNIIKIEVFA